MSNPKTFHSIFARNCEVRRIDKPTAEAFLSRNHLYGYCSCGICLGIFVKRYSGAENRPGAEHPYPVGTMVAAGTFSKTSLWHKEDGSTVRSANWIRYASFPEVRVLGGMGMMLDAFIALQHPDEVMSYVPADIFAGDSYLKLGFVNEGLKTFDNGGSSWRFVLKLGDGRKTQADSVRASGDDCGMGGEDKSLENK